MEAGGGLRAYAGHAGHVPDTTWTGSPTPWAWMDLSPRVNISLGGQASYPVGWRPTEFSSKGAPADRGDQPVARVRHMVAVRAMTVVDAVRDLYRAHWGEPSRRARFEVGEFDIEVYEWAADGLLRQGQL